jgi:hypothetical protein
MPKSALVLACALAALVGGGTLRAQQTPTKEGRASLVVTTQVTIGGTKLVLSRKRFFLFSGDRKSNSAIEQAVVGHAGEFQARDCYYCTQGVSKEYMDWLRAADCETPYCREVSDADLKIPEFAAAYQLALAKYKGKPDIARRWITPFIPAEKRDGYYQQKKKLLGVMLGTAKPLGAVMTDATSYKATFIDIPISKPNDKGVETFFLTNAVPIEFMGKAYTWLCPVNLKVGNTQFQLPTKDGDKSCKLIIQDLPKCSAGGCSK